MSTIEGAKTIGRDDLIGSIEPGKRADILILDTARTNMTPLHEPAATIVYQATGAEVDTVIVDGRILLRHGVPTILNAESEAELRAEAQRRSIEIMRRSGIG
jgi:5-methylthioadenosine/S-adenosylhomocysteine deaminase